jgi:hypothetical protein
MVRIHRPDFPTLPHGSAHGFLCDNQTGLPSMRLHTKRIVVNLTVFAGALCFILYLQTGQSSGGKIFSWNAITYRTTSASIPEARGICPGLNETSLPTLVVSRVAVDGDPGWLKPLAQKYHLCVFKVDASKEEHSNERQVPANRGHEAMAYLTFIIDNYDALPDSGIVFVHGSRYAWHNDHPEYDNAKLLVKLNVTSALEPLGYHNLRCDWSASTCAADYGPPQGSFETKMNAKLQPWDFRSVSDAELPKALAVLFGREGLAGGSTSVVPGRSDALRAQCCAQFVVSRDRIWQHTRDEYIALRQWLLDGSLDNPNRNVQAAHSDDRIAGRVLSYLWHILFLPQDGAYHDLDNLNTLACPTAADCYCRLYGMCDMAGCNHPGHCQGRYTLPAEFSLPKDWATTHP